MGTQNSSYIIIFMVIFKKSSLASFVCETLSWNLHPGSTSEFLQQPPALASRVPQHLEAEPHSRGLLSFVSYWCRSLIALGVSALNCYITFYLKTETLHLLFLPECLGVSAHVSGQDFKYSVVDGALHL